jgi:hypothetical protein
VADVPALEFIDRYLSHVLPRGFQHVRYYGFLAPKGRATRLEAIRRMLGCEGSAEEPEQDEPQRDELRGDVEEEPASAEGYPCPACGKRRMIRTHQTPRPTVREILAMPFPTSSGQERRDEVRRTPYEGVCPTTSRAAEAPDELRQRLLPLVFR